MTAPCYRWKILQEGTLPYRPDGTFRLDVGHACTATLLWPDGAPPDRTNTLLVDPALVGPGLTQARRCLLDLGIAPETIGWYFQTHDHGDHALTWGLDALGFRPEVWRGPGPQWPGIELVRLPGHEPGLRALRFRTVEGEVWIVGDAALDLEYLLAWRVYEPNGYGKGEILQTYRDVAKVLESADIVIPGHAGPIAVTAALLRDLREAFPLRAHFRGECPEVIESLDRRLRSLV